MTAARGDASDEMLMVRYQRGDREAFAELVLRYEHSVYNFAIRQLHAAQLSENLTEDVFRRVVENAADFKHEARFSAWLYAIARTLCVEQLTGASLPPNPLPDRKAAGAGNHGQAASDSIPDVSTPSRVEPPTTSSQVQNSVLEVIDALPGEQREVFLLRELANLPFEDIARITGAPENTVKSLMRYALDRLQQTLHEFEQYGRALR